MRKILTLADWHVAHRHRRGKRPAAVPAFEGNKDRPIHSIRNLQRSLNREHRRAKAADAAAAA